ncbi:MAG TPA: deoxyribose-phosphate aldolase [Nitrososphaeria archaeon]|nr:MAG: deoxyribose-phosphate aldolase [Nitrososphaerota archaeon]HDJ66697.1 deoxyribose-phosphate aldolase [Nitrososphaeria archaeon]
MKVEDVLKKIDYTLLKPNVSSHDIVRLCDEAKRYGFYAVCVNPYYVPLASKLLKDTEIKVSSVVGFPLGASLAEIKVAEAGRIIRLGASEIDMVMNISAFKSGDLDYVRKEIKSVKEEIGDAVLKVIIECCYLTDDEKVLAAKICEEAGADYVKTSTGFGSGGAVLEDVKLLRRTLSPKVKVKAAGGIKTFEQAVKFIEAGADRIGTSSGVKIAEEGFRAGK